MIKSEKILIKGGTLIDPSSGWSGEGDLYIEDGIIRQAPSDLKGVKKINAKGQWVVPGLVDLHVHFRDPGQTHKEDIKSGLNSAIRGGFTTVCTMPNTAPTVDSPELIKYQIETAEKLGLGRILPVSALTYGLEGARVVNMEQNQRAGAVAFSDDGKSVMSGDTLEEMFKMASEVKALVMVHCEDPSMNPNDNASEWTIVKRDIDLAIKYNVRLHICHVSAKESVDLIRQAKRTHPGLITAEVSPHHIALTSSHVKGNTNFKMAPPLRSEQDRQAMIAGLVDGTIDCIATDHAPHAKKEKDVEWDKAPNGIIGLETAVGVVLTEMYHDQKLSREKVVAMMSSNPARIIGRSASLSVGAVADIAIIDPNKTWVPLTYLSKSENSPFTGRKLKGKVTTTIFNGRVVYKGKKTDMETMISMAAGALLLLGGE